VDPQLLSAMLHWVKRGTIALVALLLLGGIAGFAVVRLQVGPRQPIPFSHKLHVTQKGISCFFCHESADHSPHAGIPPVEKCLLCHRVIIPEFRPIRPLHEYQRRQQGVPWVRVNVVPDFVFFNHQIHLARGIDCGQCHGDVKQMDRVRKVNRMDMGFCVNCHWQKGASNDCWTCHR